MRSIGILGPFGAGKTALLADIAGSLHRGGAHVRAVVNDVLAGRADAERIARTHAEFSFLSGGCIGCQDRESFLRAVHGAKRDGIEYFVFEQPGVTHGHELVASLSELISGEDAMRFVCLWDASSERHAHNASLPIISTSLRVADIVGVTKAWGDIRSLSDDVLLHLATQSQAPILMIPKDGSVGSELVGRLFSAGSVRDTSQMGGSVFGMWKKSLPLSCGTPGHAHGPDCHVGHVHESGKSAIYAARLHPHADTTTANLETFLAKHAHDIERIKGVLADDTGKLRYVQYVPGSPVDTSEEAPTGSVPELLVYCRDEETRSSAEAIFGHRVDTDDLSRTDAKSLMSRVSDDTPESVLISHVRYLLSLYPAEIAAVEEAVPPADFGDADLAYQIVKNRRLPDWIRRETYALWIGKRLESLRLMSSMGESVTRTPPGTYVFRRLGSNLAWHAGQPERFGLSENICKVIWDSRPGYALAEWLSQVTEPMFREEAAEERPEFVYEAFVHAINNEPGFTSSMARNACKHMAELSTTLWKSDWAERWNKAAASLSRK